MKNNIQKIEDSNWHEHKMFKDGYGKFPYVILKVGYALFMQIPIHFNKNNDFINYPEQIQEASSFFSEQEWEIYLTNLTNSNHITK